MKVADLYVRVSTDEQADKGYSQRSQEELLRRYCNINSISVRQVILEDHSAKTFNRPEWKKYLLDLKRHKGKADLVLFLKWDRFSRNAGDAYQMINTLRKLGVEPQAIEQPLDLTVPENKMMLAFYLAAPEVENDRRALNVIHGMRRAKKEGRYMGLAPVGYINRTDEAGRKYIAPREPEAGIIKWAFEQLAEGVYNTEQILKMAREKGYKRTKGLFWFAIRNPVYCGKIFIEKYKDEEARFVKGTHEPIISEALYYQVQDVLDGRKRNSYRLKVVSNASLPLRGFLICPKCGKLLTGSASKGLTRYYSYYHCFDGCVTRFRADLVNGKLVEELRKYVPRPEMSDLYKITLSESWYKQTSYLQDDHKTLLREIKEQEEKISYIRDLLSTKQIDPADFREMKTEYTGKLEKLEARLAIRDQGKEDVHGLLSAGIDNLLKLDYIYEDGGIERKRVVISSMYPEKLTFDGDRLRTNRINEAARIIYTLDKGLDKNERGQSGNIPTLSSQVGTTRFELATPCTPCKCATGLRYVPKLEFRGVQR
jgi:site-specific DNA recombinase